MKKLFLYFIDWFKQQVNLFYLLVFKICEDTNYDGLRLYAIKNEYNFFKITKEALHLIKVIDPRRYSRIRKYLKSIAFVQMGSNCYIHRLRSYFVDDFPEDIEYYASSIIHESTHGFLRSKGFIYLPEKQEQHERICTKEQFRFLEKIILNKKELTEEQQRNEVINYKKHFEDALKKQWWNRKVMRERRMNRLKSILKKEFIQRTHYVTGSLESEIKIVEGKKNGPYRCYYENGTLKEEGNYLNDKIEGLVKYYYLSGLLQSEANYSSNKQDGIYKIYYEDGTLQQEGIYCAGNPDGLVKWYSEKGNLITEAKYENGKITNDVKHYD